MTTYQLPEPVAWRFFYAPHGWPTFHSAEYVREYMPGQTKDNGLFTVDQMQAAYAAGVAAGRQMPNYDKSELNAAVQELYDAKMREGKHGHYETMFHCVHAAIRRVFAAAPEPKP